MIRDLFSYANIRLIDSFSIAKIRCVCMCVCVCVFAYYYSVGIIINAQQHIQIIFAQVP